MFNKYFWNVPVDQTAASLDRMTNAIRDFSKSHEVISQADIKSKDRVDIPLSEYLHMKETIEKQDYRLRSLYCTIKHLGIPYEVIDGIVPDSIQVYKDRDLKDFITHYIIKFDVDESLDILRGGYK